MEKALERRPVAIKQMAESSSPPSDRTAVGVSRNGPDPSEPSSGASTRADVSIVIQAQNGARFTVASTTDQLQQIGELLRGKPKGFDRRTVLTSIAVTIGTLFLSSLIGGAFQYASWLNSIRLQNATDHAAKAAAVYEKAIAAIGTRRFATISYLQAAQNIVDKKEGAAGNLSKALVDQDQRDMAGYSDALKAWNTGYDQMLTDIDYALDQPAFLAAGVSTRNLISAKQTEKVDCAFSLNEQMDKAGMDRRSLKGQFAVIALCFGRATPEVDQLRTKSLTDHEVTISDQVKSTAENRLEAISSMSNVFRCYAQQRLTYYYGLKERAILSPAAILRDVLNRQSQIASEHFTAADQRCALH
jgi:hypothetical protein